MLNSPVKILGLLLAAIIAMVATTGALYAAGITADHTLNPFVIFLAMLFVLGLVLTLFGIDITKPFR